MNDFVPKSDEEDIFEEEMYNLGASMLSTTAAGPLPRFQMSRNCKHNPTSSNVVIPHDVLDNAKLAESILVPPTSKQVYDRAYNKFKKFIKDKGITTINEQVLLGYFWMLARPAQIENQLSPGSLWSIHSMLKKTLSVYDSIDIDKYQKVSMFLSANEKQSGHVKKKASVFTNEEIARFLHEAPDQTWLATKVVMIIGVHGLCRRAELYKLTLKSVQNHGTCINFVLEKTKNGGNRDFSLTGEYCDLVKKYLCLRPQDYTEKSNLFVKYTNGRCHRQIMGIHKIGSIPKEIATYLGLPDPDSYTGHAFRRTGATVAANAGMDILTLKKLGGWKSTPIAESYVHHTQAYKNKLSVKMSRAISKARPDPSTVTKLAASLPSTASQSVDTCSSTSYGEVPPSAPEKTSFDPYLNPMPSTSGHRENVELPGNHPLMNIPHNSQQNIQLHFHNCTGLHFFNRQDDKNPQ